MRTSGGDPPPTLEPARPPCRQPPPSIQPSSAAQRLRVLPRCAQPCHALTPVAAGPGSGRRARGLARITHLRMDRQRLAAAEPSAWARMPRLTNLYLQHNRLPAVPDVSGIDGLRFLTLAHNAIAQVPAPTHLGPALRSLPEHGLDDDRPLNESDCQVNPSPCEDSARHSPRAATVSQQNSRAEAAPPPPVGCARWRGCGTCRLSCSWTSATTPSQLWTRASCQRPSAS